MMRVLLTGAAGFIGGHIGTALVRRGYGVTGVDTRRPKASGDPHFPVEILPFWDLLPRVRAGEFDVVVHQAAVTSTLAPSSPELMKVNSSGVADLANACSRGGSRLVFASSASVYGAITSDHVAEVGDESLPQYCTGPLNPYATSKLAAERHLAAVEGLDFVALRYTNVFGTGEHSKGSMACILTQMIERAVRREEIRLFSDTLLASRDFVPVSRVIDGVVRVVEHPGRSSRQTFNLGSGVNLRFAEILQWLGSWSCGGDIRVKLVPNPVAARYQYRTAVHTARAETALRLPRLSVEDVLNAAVEVASTMSKEGSR